MSYCRWSSDDFSCDLHCYQSMGGGYTTHVAASRYVFSQPLPSIWGLSAEFPDLNETARQAIWVMRLGQRRHIMDNTTMVDITLPHAGETFSDGCLAAFKGRLLMLRGLGYKFPDYVIDDIDSEMKAEAEKSALE